MKAAPKITAPSTAIGRTTWVSVFIRRPIPTGVKSGEARPQAAYSVVLCRRTAREMNAAAVLRRRRPGGSRAPAQSVAQAGGLLVALGGNRLLQLLLQRLADLVPVA